MESIRLYSKASAELVVKPILCGRVAESIVGVGGLISLPLTGI